MRTSPAVLLALTLACGPSGGGGDPEPGVGPDAGGEGQGGGEQVCTDGIDVVFVLDVSSSMGYVLEDLHDNIAGVVDAANALAPGARFGLVAYSDNGALDLGGALEGGAVHDSAETLTTSFQAVREVYTNNDRNPGDGPGGPTQQNPICEENSPDALVMAATEFPWRAQATRIVILATDDTFLPAGDNYGDGDGDGDTTGVGFPREGDYPAAHGIEDATTALTERDIRVFSFTRLREPGLFDFTRCGTGRRLEWSQITDGWTTSYDGSPPIPEATDGANFDLDAVRDGALSLAETITQVVVDSHCDEVE